MAGSILTAVIAAFAAIAGIYLTQFLAERYRRFMDGTALAAGLKGELSSYKPMSETLHLALRTWIAACKQGHRERIYIRPVPQPTDQFYSQAVAKLGLLGPALVEDVIYVYSNIGAFRVAFGLVGQPQGHER